MNVNHMERFYRRDIMGKFEKFSRKQLQPRGEPAITVTKAGIINFNLATMKRYVKDNKYATLYYNKEDLLIGIKFSAKKEWGSYKIIKYRNNKFGTISGTAFLKYYNIPYPETIGYSAEWNEQDKMLIIDLKEHTKKELEGDDDIPF